MALLYVQMLFCPSHVSKQENGAGHNPVWVRSIGTRIKTVTAVPSFAWLIQSTSRYLPIIGRRVGPMLAQRLRRWPSIRPTRCRSFVFLGLLEDRWLPLWRGVRINLGLRPLCFFLCFRWARFRLRNTKKTKRALNCYRFRKKQSFRDTKNPKKSFSSYVIYFASFFFVPPHYLFFLNRSLTFPEICPMVFFLKYIFLALPHQILDFFLI